MNINIKNIFFLKVLFYNFIFFGSGEDNFFENFKKDHQSKINDNKNFFSNINLKEFIPDIDYQKFIATFPSRLAGLVQVCSGNDPKELTNESKLKYFEKLYIAATASFLMALGTRKKSPYISIFAFIYSSSWAAGNLENSVH